MTVSESIDQYLVKREKPKVSISTLATSLHSGCKKKIYLTNTMHHKLTTSDIFEARMEYGNTFESELVKYHGEKMIDHQQTKDYYRVLETAQPGTYIYNLKIPIPPEDQDKIFRHQNKYVVSSFIPDLLYIYRDSTTGIRKIRIIDAKATYRIKKYHQFQVISYAIVLEYIIRHIDDLEIDQIGGVWLETDLEAPVLFRIDLAIQKVRYFYQYSLVEILEEPEKNHWSFSEPCSDCQFQESCRSEAAGTIRSIPFMDQIRLAAAKEKKLVDIEDLSGRLADLKLGPAVPDRLYRFLETHQKASQEGQARYLGGLTVWIGSNATYEIHLDIQVNQYTRLPYAYAMTLVDADAETIAFSHVSTYRSLLNRPRETYSRWVDMFIRDLRFILNTMDACQSRCHLFFLTPAKKADFQNVLYRIVQDNPCLTLSAPRKARVTQYAMQCLVHFFYNEKLLSVSPQIRPMDDFTKESSAPFVVTITDIYAKKVALGISGYPAVIDLVRRMTGEGDYPELDEDGIFRDWLFKGPRAQIEPRVLKRLERAHALVRSFLRLIEPYQALPLCCPVFGWSRLIPCRSGLIAKMILFKQIECISNANAVWNERMSDLTDPLEPKGLLLDFVSQQDSPKKQIVFRVDPVSNGPTLQQKLDTLKLETFRSYILVVDKKSEILKSILYNDLSEIRSDKKGGPLGLLGMFCVDIKSINGYELITTGQIKRTQNKKWRMFRRYVDFITIPSINRLLKMDGNDEWEDIENLLLNPNEWASKNLEHSVVLNETTLNLLKEYKMSFSQQEITQRILKTRLQIVWGPPGSGKTEFLALFINWYIQSFASLNSRKEELMIGITAVTHDAIVNLLKRIEVVQRRHHLEDLFSIIYVKSSKPVPWDETSQIQIKPWNQTWTLKNKIKKAKSISIFVYGVTVWHWDKINSDTKPFDGCDLMIIDEASQMLVPDSLLAVSCLKKSGKLIIAGDHLQLGPIVLNDYSTVKREPNEPLIFGSVQQCLMRTESNEIIHAHDFTLKNNTAQTFGPNTMQLKDNWRMNEPLNNFYQLFYGPDYTSMDPSIHLELDWSLLRTYYKNTKLIKEILNPSKVIALVKLAVETEHMIVETEAEAAFRLVQAYLQTNLKQNEGKPNVMVVCPHHVQRIAIKRRLQDIDTHTLMLDTTEKMQGQQTDLVIACFSFINSEKGLEFLRNFRRWNVAVSRARCKVIILTTDRIIRPLPEEGFFEEYVNTLEPADGMSFITNLEQWAIVHDSVFDWKNQRISKFIQY